MPIKTARDFINVSIRYTEEISFIQLMIKRYFYKKEPVLNSVNVFKPLDTLSKQHKEYIVSKIFESYFVLVDFMMKKSLVLRSLLRRGKTIQSKEQAIKDTHVSSAFTTVRHECYGRILQLNN